LYAFLISLVCCIPHPSHPSCVDHPYNIRWRVQVTELLIMQFSPCTFLLHRPKYSPQHSVLICPQSMFFPQGERPSFTPIQNKK
jgi:hypothetical protein